MIAAHWPDEGAILRGAEHLLERAAAVITVSGASKNRILERFPSLSGENVHVIWNGVDHNSFHAEIDAGDVDRRNALGITGPYLLYVGGVTARKNVAVLLAAHRRLTDNRRQVPKLVLAGPWSRRSLGDFRTVNPSAFVLGDVPSSSVPALMRGAELVLLPSKEEGFGLPLLEAQACGTLAVCSDIAVFREIGGDAPLYVDSGDCRALAVGIEKALQMGSKERLERRDRGLRHAKAFSWSRSAAAHAEVYKRVIARQ